MAGDTSRPTHRALGWVWNPNTLAWVAMQQPVINATVGAITNDGTFAKETGGFLANLDVALSTRLKPADTLAAVTTVGTITNPVAPKLTAGAPPVGQTKIAVTGTAVQLATNTLTNGVIVTAKSTNTQPITVGGSGVTNTVDGTGNGYILEAGASISFAVDNSNRLFVNGTAGDIVSFAGS